MPTGKKLDCECGAGDWSMRAYIVQRVIWGNPLSALILGGPVVSCTDVGGPVVTCSCTDM